jgi:DNA polymerase-3 subunit gamma/tau
MEAWYLKYRSQKVSELDLKSVRESLGKIMASGKVPKALLFTGPRGIGKTSAARILAKVLNCEKNKDSKSLAEPCNQCSQCKAITNGSHLDVLEIDAASNRGIDDVRELRERVKLAPSTGIYRVYIIDEVHMLTNEAFNALLKTLEEPPAHAVFILCTTDPQKLPETIMSRCTRIIFKRATDAEVLGKLERVAKAEKLEVEKDGLELLAKGAKGSFRDGVKILEQAAGGVSSTKITLADVRAILGHTAGVEPLIFLNLLVERDGAGAIKEIGKVVASGENLKSYTERLVEILREELLVKVGVMEGELEEGKKLKVLSVEETDQLIRILSRSYVELREAVVPQLPLELAAVEWCGAEGSNSNCKSNSKEEVRHEPEEPGKEKNDVETKIPEGVQKVVESELADVTTVTDEISLDKVSNHWQEVMQKVRPKNHSVEALLRACQPLSIEKGFLVIEVFYKFHKDRLECDRYRQIVEEAVAEVVGVPIRLRYKLGERAAKKLVADQESAEPVQNVEGGAVEDEILSAAAEIFKGAVVE